MHTPGIKNKTNKNIYCIKCTPSYVIIKCDVDPQCRFMMWFTYSRSIKNMKEKKITKIKYKKMLNRQHDYELHEKKGLF